MTVLHMEDVVAMGAAAVIEKARAVIGDGPTYVTFDIDSIDPGFAPGTGTPEVGGLTPREVLAILRGIAGTHIIGGDVMEVAPQYDATTNTAQVAAQMLFTELCLVALDPKFVPRKAHSQTPSVDSGLLIRHEAWLIRLHELQIRRAAL